MTSRIKGPGDGPPPPATVDPSSEIRSTEAIEPAAPSEVGGVQATQPAGAAQATDAVAEVAADLRAGRITVEQAVERLIDDAVERQIGRAVENREKLAGQLRDILRGYAQSDPFLAAKIRRLTMAK